MSSETTTTHHADAEHGDHEGMSKKRIMKVFWILLGITAIEFFVALVIAPKFPHAEWINPIYIVLTLFKAFYIVAFFMHLKFEKMGLIMAIVVPVLFIIGLILVLTNESHYWIDLRL
ncbi:MAG: cytochrome C oxidase subunit IV family protein [Mucilaginibacter sp.]|uniref:cytochrome C oxidase subunit IV family protein n=1 Tax=Mucilaginibacter sp. L3T2-6 TaxID=3062491 RepID=UPI002675267D|nr:cytochrome C oxidase subunit IV family protein [Mucilaginibacter sp. L3T2-6]MDO3640503.1 cytochrome C oxidase subunit IV family protein [Mucilaginibacter sp. L3T2-6]MDV6213158.1 cytochrome C oxidase subunit IV family protein [Mucilaginibacter sp. L3T2-6]